MQTNFTTRQTIKQPNLNDYLTKYRSTATVCPVYQNAILNWKMKHRTIRTTISKKMNQWLNY